MTHTKNTYIVRVAGGVAVFALVASPFVASVASAANTTINASVAPTISMTTSGTVGISLTPTSGGVVSSSSDAVSVTTNAKNGYTLKLADADATTTLANGAETITAHTGTYAVPTALGTNSWGYRIVGQGGFGPTAYSAETNAGSSTSTWAGVPASGSDTTIKTTASKATSGDPTTVWYGVKADNSLSSGTYTDTVTYTATANP